MIEKAKKVFRGRLWMLPIWLLTGKAHADACPICEKRTFFVKYHPWLRDNYRCIRCWSIPRQRAIVKVLDELAPQWNAIAVHESSPGGVSSDFVRRKARNYIATHFYSDVAPGQMRGRFRCENLEDMTFEDEMFDLIITQDVMEHVLDPASAFSEICRTLKPGGMHVFTVPVYKDKPTRVRAQLSDDGEIEYLAEPDYHGNPIDDEGSLVAREWGMDIVEFIEEHSGLKTEVRTFDTDECGLRAEHLEVLISRKPELGQVSSGGREQVAAKWAH